MTKIEKENNKLMRFKKSPKNFQPNIITNSRQEMNVYERRLFAMVLNQIDHFEKIEEGQGLIFEIPIKDISENIPYKDIKKTVLSLQNKNIFTENEELETFHSIIIFPDIEYNLNKDGIVRLELHRKIVPYFIELGKQYISYDLESYLSLSSVFSQRLYEIILMYVLRQKPLSKPIYMSVSYLQSRLQCNYPDFFDFKQRVLNHAQKELLQKTGLDFSYSPSKKEGKKVIELSFIVNKLPNNPNFNESRALLHHEDIQEETPKGNFDFSLDLYNNEIVENQIAMAKDVMGQYKFTKQQKEQILFTPNLRKLFIETHLKIVAGLITDIKNPSAYIAQTLGFGKK